MLLSPRVIVNYDVGSRDERPGEIDWLIAANNVFDSPLCLYGCGQSLLIVVCGCNHVSSSQSVCAKHCVPAALQLESRELAGVDHAHSLAIETGSACSRFNFTRRGGNR